MSFCLIPCNTLQYCYVSDHYSRHKAIDRPNHNNDMAENAVTQAMQYERGWEQLPDEPVQWLPWLGKITGMTQSAKIP